MTNFSATLALPFPLDSSRKLGDRMGMLRRSVSALLLTLALPVYGAGAPNVTAASAGEPLVLSNTSFDFGTAIVGFPISKTVAVVTNTRKAAMSVVVSVSGDPSFSLVRGGNDGCGLMLASGQSCNLQVSYAPQSASAPAQQTTTLFVGTIDAKRYIGHSMALTGISGAMSAGVVTPTGNTMVAQYALTLPFAGSWSVAFGHGTDYGLKTNVLSTPTGGTQTLLVAGMQANTTYHMRATVTLPNGSTATDVDHTFTTGAIPAGLAPPITTTTTAGMTPQPGIELINTILGATRTAALATDLAGNVIWTYDLPYRQPGTLLYPIKPLPNGHMLMLISPVSQQTRPVSPGTLAVMREIDLAGNTVQELSMDDLNSRVHAAGYPDLTLQVYSHDMEMLPNGHILVIVNAFKAFTDLPGYPGVTNVLGDVVVDLDKDLQPVWLWNGFDHLDVNRHPINFPDWMHTNSIAYSKDDGNFVLSVRHQNWVIKVNYKDGAGDGRIAWKLGLEGDFALQNSAGPQDWFYAQHTATFFSPNTAGVFTMGIMDNGDDRPFPDYTNCLGQTWRCYTTVPIFQVNEVDKTATVLWRQMVDPSMYSNFAGDAALLPNGNIEYNLAEAGAASKDAQVSEVTPDATPVTVWNMVVHGTYTYRALRLPSLYPGVQW